jgi:hypothetical protein
MMIGVLMEKQLQTLEQYENYRMEPKELYGEHLLMMQGTMQMAVGTVLSMGLIRLKGIGLLSILNAQMIQLVEPFITVVMEATL